MIDGKLYNFDNVGLYDGLFVLGDQQTETLWSHMTGEGLYGTHAGYRMPVSNLLQMNVGQALTMDPSMSVAISDHPFRGGMGASLSARYDPNDTDIELIRGFVVTLGAEDTRLDRMEMGLGIWDGDLHRYYPVKTIRANGNYLFDEINGEKLLVFLDPLTSTPMAIYWDAKEVRIEGRNITLDGGYSIRNQQIFDKQGNLIEVDRPQQMFTRWYGFSLTFSDPDIFR